MWFALSQFTAIGVTLGFGVLFVVLMHVWPLGPVGRDRNHPKTILFRLGGAILTCVLSVVILLQFASEIPTWGSYFDADVERSSMTWEDGRDTNVSAKCAAVMNEFGKDGPFFVSDWLGVRFEGMFLAIVVVLVLVEVCFFGPWVFLFARSVSASVRLYALTAARVAAEGGVGATDARLACAACLAVLYDGPFAIPGAWVAIDRANRSVGDQLASPTVVFYDRVLSKVIDGFFGRPESALATWRNWVVAPITEEWVFRACTIPLLLSAGFGVQWSLILAPLSFAAAHAHHAIESLRRGERVAVVLVQTIAQLAYTFLFGSFAAWLHLRTGVVIAPMLAHCICNIHGLPDFKWVSLWSEAPSPTAFLRKSSTALSNRASGRVGVLYLRTGPPLAAPGGLPAPGGMAAAGVEGFPKPAKVLAQWFYPVVLSYLAGIITFFVLLHPLTSNVFFNSPLYKIATSCVA